MTTVNCFETIKLLKAHCIERQLHRISTNSEDKCQQDLIREFALQAQHQQFSVSVNGFFELNLKLLGSVSIK